MTRPLLETVGALYASLEPRRRVQLILLFVLMLLSAVAEAVSLGAILPFLAILVDPQQAMQNIVVAKVAGEFGVSNSQELRWQFTLLFASAAVAAGLVRFVLVYATSRLNFGIGHELGAEIYRKTLYQSYDVHMARNSSEIMGGIRKVDEVVWVIFALLNMMSGALMGTFIVIALLRDWGSFMHAYL